MDTTLTIDRAGRVVIPKAVRDELHLGAGDALELQIQGETLTLRPVRVRSPLCKERGIWVYRTGTPITASDTDRTLQEIRDERVSRNLGEQR